MVWTSEVRPIEMYEKQLIEDIDKLIEVNQDRPSVAITALYVLILNCKEDKINPDLFNKIVLDYMLSPHFEDLVDKQAIDASKAVILSKIFRFINNFPPRHFSRDKQADVQN